MEEENAKPENDRTEYQVAQSIWQYVLPHTTGIFMMYGVMIAVWLTLIIYSFSQPF